MTKFLVPTQRFNSINHLHISTFMLRPLSNFRSTTPLPSLFTPTKARGFSTSSLFTGNPRYRSVSSTRAFENDVDVEELKGGSGSASSDGAGDLGVKSLEKEYPSGEFEMEEFDLWRKFIVKVRMLFALPWERVKKGSVLSMKLKGQISDQITSRFSSGLSLPQICENLTKAAYDPRISGAYLQIDPLNCGWGKIEEIRRHILNFKKTGKFILCYVPICSEREYYLGCACGEFYVPPSAYVSLYGIAVQATFIGGVLENIGIEPQVQRIGKYKSAGDSISRKSMSPENCEVLTVLLDNIYLNWLDIVASTQGKKREEIEDFLNSGVFQVQRLKEEGWITNLMYDDEIISMLKERLGVKKEKNLSIVDYKKYSRVRQWTLGLGGGKERIAIIRASGSISRTSSLFSSPSSGIVAEQLIEKIRNVRDSKIYKAVILRIDSPGGDALASDLMWREIKLLASSKPVIASMSDVAASGGYYMAMAAQTIVAEKLTLTGSIGVVTGKFSLKNLYEKIGFNKEVLSRGKFAELTASEQRPFRPDEAEFFAKAAQNSYKQFRDKAALSRSMAVDQMEGVAQGRVWSGADAASRGLVDAVGGLSRAIAIAKEKANIPQDRQVRLDELSKPRASFSSLLAGIGSSLMGLRAMNEIMHEMSQTEGVQTRMDAFIERNQFSSNSPIVSLIRNILSS